MCTYALPIGLLSAPPIGFGIKGHLGVILIKSLKIVKFDSYAQHSSRQTYIYQHATLYPARTQFCWVLFPYRSLSGNPRDTCVI